MGKPSIWLKFGREVLASQPFSVLLGAEMVALSPGDAELQLPITAQLLSHDGAVHSGVLAYLADNAMAFAGGTALESPVTLPSTTTHHIRPAVGERLIARAHTVQLGVAQALCRCELLVVQDGQERLCALVQAQVARNEAAAEPLAA